MTKIINASYSAWLLVLGPLVFVFGLGPWVDKQFPVVDPFVITEIGCSSDNPCVVISGWMEKRRDCKFLELYGYVTRPGEKMGRVVEVKFLDRAEPDDRKTRPVGSQYWGAWQINAEEGDHISLHAIHQCHPLWETKGVLAEFDVSV